MSESAGEMVPHKSPTDLVSDWGFGNLLGRYFFSFNEQGQGARNKAFQLLNADGKPLMEYMEKRIDIVAFVLQPTTFADAKSGEEITTLMAKLMLDTGDVLMSHSGPTAKALLQAYEMLGPPSEQHPYRCIVRQRKSRHVGVMHYLDFSNQVQ